MASPSRTNAVLPSTPVSQAVTVSAPSTTSSRRTIREFLAQLPSSSPPLAGTSSDSAGSDFAGPGLEQILDAIAVLDHARRVGALQRYALCPVCHRQWPGEHLSAIHVFCSVDYYIGMPCLENASNSPHSVREVDEEEIANVDPPRLTGRGPLLVSEDGPSSPPPMLPLNRRQRSPSPPSSPPPLPQPAQRRHPVTYARADHRRGVAEAVALRGTAAVQAVSIVYPHTIGPKGCSTIPSYY
jgi:hypothetical protein